MTSYPKIPIRGEIMTKRSIMKHLFTILARPSIKRRLYFLNLASQLVKKVNLLPPGWCRLSNRWKLLESLTLHVLPCFTNSFLLTLQLVMHVTSWNSSRSTSDKWLMKSRRRFSSMVIFKVSESPFGTPLHTNSSVRWPTPMYPPRANAWIHYIIPKGSSNAHANSRTHIYPFANYV